MGKMAIKRWTRFRMAVLIFVVWLFAFGVFIGIFYLSNRHNTQKYADEGNIKLFYTIHHSVEGMLNETSQTLLDLLINRQDNRLINGFCANTSGDLQSVQELLFSVMQKKSYIFDIFLYGEVGERFIRANSSDDSLRSLSYYLEEEDIGKVRKPYYTDAIYTIIPLKSEIRTDNATVEQLALMINVYSQESLEQTGKLLVLFNRNIFRERAGLQALEPDKEFYLIDGDSRMLFSTRRALIPSNLKADNLFLGKNPQYQRTDRGEYIDAYAYNAAIGGNKYVMVAPGTQNILTTNRGVTVILGGCGILTVAAVAALVLILRKREKWTSDVLSLVDESSDINVQKELQNKDKDYNRVARAMIEKRGLDLMFNKYRRNIYSDAFSRLLIGKSQCAETKDLMERMGMGRLFFHTHYALLVFSVVEIGVDSEEEGADWALLQFVVDNILHDFYHTNTVTYNHCVVSMVDFKEVVTEEHLKTAVETVIRVCEEQLQCHLQAGISSIQAIEETISPRFMEAMQALRQLQLMENQTIMTYTQAEEQQRFTRSDYANLINTQYFLINNHKNWDSDELASLFDQMLSIIQEGKCVTFEMARLLIEETIHAMRGNMRQLYVWDEDTDGRLNAIEQGIQSCFNITQLRQTIGGFLKVVQSVLSAQKDNTQDVLFREVEAIIEEKYSDPNLSVAYIADIIGIHFSTLSSTYKRQSGCGLLERINIFRTEKAKEFLIHTNDTVGDISLKTGYENINTFIRIFKKYTGITPGRFRDIHRPDEN